MKQGSEGKSGKKRKNPGGEVFLITAADESEYEVLKSLLNAHGIPVLKKSREAGGYMNIAMGMNVYGVDIYVPEKYYDEAAELVKGADDGKEDGGELETATEDFRNKRLMYVWIIIAVIYFVPFLIWLVYSVIKKG